MAIKRRTKVEPAFSMSSMTDIVFLLLIFFLVPQAPAAQEHQPDLRKGHRQRIHQALSRARDLHIPHQRRPPGHTLLRRGAGPAAPAPGLRRSHFLDLRRPYSTDRGSGQPYEHSQAQPIQGHTGYGTGIGASLTREIQPAQFIAPHNIQQQQYRPEISQIPGQA